MARLTEDRINDEAMDRFCIWCGVAPGAVCRSAKTRVERVVPHRARCQWPKGGHDSDKNIKRRWHVQEM